MSDCILWAGARLPKGYGITSVNGKNAYAHRVAASNAFGPIPLGMVVAHKCDNPPCVNPEHLFICTQADNLRDMREKGRSHKGDKHGSKTRPERVPRGETVGTSKLTEEQVIAIRADYKFSQAGKHSPTSLTSVAAKYGISFQTVHKIVRGKTWTHL